MYRWTVAAFAAVGAAVALAVAGLGTSAYAADRDKAPVYVKALAPVATNDILKVNNQFYLDFAATNFNYKELFGGGILDTEKGWASPGLQYSLSMMTNVFDIRNVYASATLTWTHGDITHGEANPAFNGMPTHSDVKDYDLRIGKGFDIGSTFMLTPYLGVGWHDWSRVFPGAGGYAELYNHYYEGGGLLAQYSPLPNWVLSAYGLAGKTQGSHLDVTRTPGGFPIPPQTFVLGDSTIFLAGGSIDYAIYKQWHANVGFDYTNFKYGISPVGVGGFLEPDSRTSNFTVKAGVGYSFYTP